jgi:hypothetical protein
MTDQNQSRNSSRMPWWRRVSQPKSTLAKSRDSNAFPGGFADLDDRIGRRDQQVAPVLSTQISIDHSLELPQNTPRAKRKSRLRRMSGVKESSSSELDTCGEHKVPRMRGWFKKRPKTIYNLESEFEPDDLGVCLLTASGESPFPSQKQTSGMVAQAIPVAKTSIPDPRAPGEWNLLQRIFRTKPESRVLVMNLSRPGARTIICGFLLQERANGICDLYREPHSQFAYTGRLDAINSKSNHRISEPHSC